MILFFHHISGHWDKPVKRMHRDKRPATGSNQLSQIGLVGRRPSVGWPFQTRRQMSDK